MLPFLKKDRAPGIATEYRKPDEEKSNENDGLEYCCQDFMDAVKANDRKAAASALRAAFELLDSEPHVEGEHLNEDVSDQ